MRQLSREEKDMLWIGLGLRENIIETGNPYYGADTINKIGRAAAKEHRATIKALSVDQMKLLIASKELAAKILSDKLYIND